ncbi:hypothetical protein LJC48_07615 [Desulfovibrio sp. OttesenSCG-928-C06]|nr:hypothetical protein [Desulfovibrio sp. OttesenSCG-928-C06]
MVKMFFAALCFYAAVAGGFSSCAGLDTGTASNWHWGSFALAAEEFSATENPSSGLLKGGGGKVGQGIRPGTTIGSPVPPHKDLRPNLTPNRVDNPDARHTNITNRADRNRLNSPNH